MTKEERQALFNKPNAREESIRRITGAAPPPPVTNGWGSGSANGASDAMQNLAISGEAEGATTTGGKKKGKGKQLLFTVSARPT